MSGIGAMIHQLSGGSDLSIEGALEKVHGKLIDTAVIVDEEELIITFEDNTRLILTDEGQSCCESRYMTCDDDLSGLSGQTLVNIEEREYKVSEGEYDAEHEQVFIHFQTNKDSFTICTHNEHNGYYGGFGLNLEVEENESGG